MRARIRNLTVSTVLLWTGVLCGGVEASEVELLRCRLPVPPEIPDGLTATETELADAGEAVRAFVADVQHSLDCLDALAPGLPANLRARVPLLYNNGVDQMHEVADAYNAQLRRRAARQEQCGGLDPTVHCTQFIPRSPDGGDFTREGHHMH